jgi:dihydrofolate reductase
MRPGGTRHEEDQTMRKIVAGLFVSLDGVTESPETWAMQFHDDEVLQTLAATLENKDTLLLGRRTFEEFAAFWPNQSPDSDPFAGFINDTPKVVVSTTLGQPEWQPTTVVRSLDDVGALKEKPGNDIGMTGSVTLTRSLLQEGLLDQLGVLIHPVVLGSGKHLFDDVTSRIPLKVVDSKMFKTGVVSVTYAPASA